MKHGRLALTVVTYNLTSGEHIKITQGRKDVASCFYI
jgi:hypothetical protein